jgi:sugar phosphate isomerase/epimerase
MILFYHKTATIWLISTISGVAMQYPKICLAMDNCFAIKRWARPSEWMPLVGGLGARYVEASTDNEIDPLFMPREYMEDWLSEVQSESARTGVQIANFFTGYQTYRTIGLAHHDARARRRIMDGWFGTLVPFAARLGAGIGFSFHAMPETTLQNPELCNRASQELVSTYAELAVHAWKEGRVALSCEQMYAPHQSPWRIAETRKFLSDIYAESSVPFYTTVDVGHMVGQRRFLKPSAETIERVAAELKAGRPVRNVWLGPDEAWSFIGEHAATLAPAEIVRAVQEIIERYPYLFAEDRDGKPYEWLRELGAYSPIIHMQQTDGITSGHAPFTAQTNERGIINGKDLLEALLYSYEQPEDPAMPPRAGTIHLSFELFISNISYLRDSLADLRSTVDYWRQYVPEDGIPLDILAGKVKRSN